jgi:hypothetical protein
MANELKLKPGNHQFLPGDSFHNNDNTTPEQLAWYLSKYPYIAKFIEVPAPVKETKAAKAAPVKEEIPIEPVTEEPAPAEAPKQETETDAKASE